MAQIYQPANSDEDATKKPALVHCLTDCCTGITFPLSPPPPLLILK